ncbi:hypothetical protein NCLIV_058580 [Neospora caninum Liverpool]|uniref:Radical SAM domain-containing protein n=1 Tax=Neospora caninum (strain Liverpool) TaxID=572307 RepID=F0VNY9_NEOCL|nr:hypothetical protein NCLIV_058580 [Neospora caninum Liverpool]CBZ55435.1 hypothetical protein NCLIV_058580 [Neospora caninum Liverpool]|eukprot:XP_003885463.1 hypothetical protein NCLIV_058580 [Neospora caninum Liverpool]
MLLFSFFLYAVNQPEPFLILGLRTRDGPVDCGAGTGLGVRLPFTRNLSISPVLRLSPFLKTALVRGRQERRCTLSRSASWVVPQAPLLFLSPVSFLFSSQTSKMRNNFSKLRASPGTFLLDANACLRDPPHCTARLSHDTAPLRFSFHTWGSQTAATSEPIEELFSLSRNAPKGLVSVFPPPPSARPDGGCFRHQEKMGGVAGCRLGASPAARYRVPTETLEMDRGLEKQRPLVTERMNERMEKQGYKIVGTHSAVKLCRWQVDPPEWVLQHALDAHWSLIKPLRGVHGVTPEAFAEAKEPRHCALSLIGEALMYPRINEFVDLLHAKRISSFLVMNGQHPDLLADLTTVTQLYVSVDAPNKKDLKAIDRPLFKDYWERLLASLEILREKRERTVLRMTLIKSVNDDDLEGYARLVELGQPNFIEIKGVTFAGHSPQFNLTLSHTPHMQETVEFSQRLLKVLNARGAGTARVEQSESCEDVAPMYRLASIHEHTNAVLLADARLFLLPANAQAGIAPNRESSSLSPSERSGRSDGSGEDSAGMELQNNLLARDGGRGSSGPGGLQESRESLQWYTHIDFEKFFALSTEERHAQNYRKATPSWALPDSPLRGFDPRFDVDKYVKQIAGRPHSLPAVGEQGSAFSH